MTVYLAVGIAISSAAFPPMRPVLYVCPLAVFLQVYVADIHQQSLTGLAKLDTSVVSRLRSDSNEDAPASVIHAPTGFKSFAGDQARPFSRSQGRQSSIPQPIAEASRSYSSAAQSDKSEATIVSPTTPESQMIGLDKVCPPSTSLETLTYHNLIGHIEGNSTHRHISTL